MLLGSDTLASTLGVLVTWVLSLPERVGRVTGAVVGEVLLIMFSGTEEVNILVRGLPVLLVTGRVEEELSREG